MSASDDTAKVAAESTVVSDVKMPQTDESESKSDVPEMVKLESSDGKLLEISLKAAQRSSLLYDIIQMVVGDDLEKLREPIPMVKVDGKNLELVTQFMMRHESEAEYKEPPPGPIRVPGDELDRIEKMTDDEIIDVLLAANYMGVHQYRDFICQHIANLIKEKTPEEVRARFNLENDFEPEDEKYIKEVDAWAEELPSEKRRREEQEAKAKEEETENEQQQNLV